MFSIRSTVTTLSAILLVTFTTYPAVVLSAEEKPKPHMHVHLGFASLPQAQLFTSRPGYSYIYSAGDAEDMLMQGVTVVRNMGGDVFGRHETSFLKTSDGLTLFTQAWLPDSSPRAIVLVVHGYGEHSSRYDHIANALVQANYAVYALDHRGHGKSEGLKAYFPSIKEPVNDLHSYFETVQRLYPKQKIFVYGHSMGSLISLLFVLKYQNDVAGLILTGSAITADENVSAPKLAVAQILSWIIPTVPLFPALLSEQLASDPSVGEAYDKDPMVYHGRWRVGMATCLLATGPEIQGQLSRLTLPLLIMHGEDDEIAPISGGHMVRDRASSIDKTFKSFPKMRHEIQNDFSKGEVIDAMIQWLNARTP
jgi:acylglycerol lipase